MHYYRYRSGSELSFKELLYNEIYFGSVEECNDPYDSKIFYEFPKDRERWRRLLDQSLNINDELFKSYLLDELSDHICSQSPLTFENFTNQHFLNTAPLNAKMQVQTLLNMEKHIRHFVGKYIPSVQYFACFSRTPTEIPMWSHYANNHKGFCLVFKSINNKLKQNNSDGPKQVQRKTPLGIAPNMSFNMPEEFEFHAIGYHQNVKALNVFKCLSQFVYGDELNERDMELLRKERLSEYLVKELSWQYEKESRLILSSPPSWLFGGQVSYTQMERLYHYQPTQLAGIIFGAKMSSEDKARLTEIILNKRAKIHRQTDTPYILFDFVISEAKLSSNQRAIEINTVEIFGTESSKVNDPDFDDRLKRWHAGWGLSYEKGKSCKNVQIL